jgi:TP901 family phage tail tape measure protein
MAESVSYKINFEDGASATIESVISKIKDLGAQVSEVEKPVESLTEKFTKWNQGTEVVQKFAKGLKDLIAPSEAFDIEMRKANTMMGLASDEYGDMVDQVRALSTEIPLAGDALAKGLYQTVSNGVPKDNWLEFLNASARSAVGGCADLEKIVGVTSTVIKNYGLEWSDAMAIQDKIQLTAKNGVTSFEQLADALPRVAGNAATLGVSIDELMGTFATLTGVSGNTAEVSTQMAAIFTSLVKPSAEASKMAAEMGIQFDAAAVKAAGGLESFLHQLGDAIGDYSAKTGTLESTIYATLFGSAEAVRALTPLQGELSAKFTENISLMRDSAGTMDEAYDSMATSSSSTLQMLSNAWNGITDSIYANFGGLISGGASVLESLGSLSDAIPILEMIGKTSAFAAVKTKVAAVATKAWGIAQGVFNTIASMNPIGLLVAAIVAAIAAITLCITKYEDFGATLLMLMGPIGMLINAIMQIKAHWDSITEAFESEGILGGIKRIGIVLMDALLYPIQQLLELCSKIPGVGNLAAGAAEKIHSVRERLNLTENETKEEKAEDGTAKTKTEGGSIRIGSGTSPIGEAISGSASAATADKGGQIKNINISIDKVVEQFTVSTTNVSDLSQVKDMVAQALVDAVNDVNYAL